MSCDLKEASSEISDGGDRAAASDVTLAAMSLSPGTTCDIYFVDEDLSLTAF